MNDIVVLNYHNRFKQRTFGRLSALVQRFTVGDSATSTGENREFMVADEEQVAAQFDRIKRF